MLCFASRRLILLIFIPMNFFVCRRTSSFVVRHAYTLPMIRTSVEVPCRSRRRRHPVVVVQSSPRLFSSVALSEDDRKYLKQAINHAKRGIGSTFPNPAVGCVLVQQDTGQVVGAGYHPRAGYPHAEVFALLEAAGHVPKGISSNGGGVAAADAIQKQNNIPMIQHVETLLQQYTADNGAEELFGNAFSNTDSGITAYVTLEPCCHFGKTPPCALSLIAAKAINRVVVGFRDPNPRVDGGGVLLLETAGINVHLVGDGGGGGGGDGHKDDNLATECHNLVTNFVKRITPSSKHDDYSYITGSIRRALRKLANTKKRDGTLAEIQWSKSSTTLPTIMSNNDDNDSVDTDSDAPVALPTPSPEWMEHLDTVLWQNELVLLRLNNAVSKKKQAKSLGTNIAQELRAHVAQTVGHTVLLYRPALPRPILNLDELDGGEDTQTEGQ